MTSLIKVDSIQTAAGGTPTASSLGIGGTGKIGQVIHNSSSTNLTSSSTSLSEMLNASITPSSTSSKILIHFSMNLNASAGSVSYVAGTVLRGTISGTNLGSKIMGHASSTNATWSLKGVYLDSPSTTSAQQYTLGFSTASGGTTSCTTDSTMYNLILMEVLA